MLVLDFDLDFVVTPIRRGQCNETGDRYEEAGVTCWSGPKLRRFLEEKMRLTIQTRIQGRSCEYHREVFSLTENLINSSRLSPPFDWVHVDAHDDIQGANDSGRVTSANFILHLIGRDWLRRLIFVLPKGEVRPPEMLMSWSDCPPTIGFGKHRCGVSFEEAAFRLDQPPDFVFATRSPDFTPPDADGLFSLVRSYIQEGPGRAAEV
jgi:hypothetical protein